MLSLTPDCGAVSPTTMDRYSWVLSVEIILDTRQVPKGRRGLKSVPSTDPCGTPFITSLLMIVIDATAPHWLDWECEYSALQNPGG